MQILGLGKVRIMRFSERKGELEVFLSGSDPDARDKEEPLRLPHGGGERKKNRAKIAGEGEAAFPIRQTWRIQKGKCRMKGEGGELPQICDRNEK